MPIVYTLTANLCPAVQRPAAILDPAAAIPATSQSFQPGETNGVADKLNQNGARSDLVGRHGGGGYAIVAGLVLSAGAGLTLNISAGQAMLDGVVPYYGGTLSLTDNTARIYVWINQHGAVIPIPNSLTPPAGACCFLGSVVTSSGTITQIDGSGVLLLCGGTLCRRTADATTPGDTPPADQQLLTAGPVCAWWWDTQAYRCYGDAGAATVTVPNGSSSTITTGNTTNQFITFTGGNGNNTVTWPAGGTTPGRAWLIYNNTSFTQTLLANGDPGAGVTVAPGRTVIVTINPSNAMTRIGPDWNPAVAAVGSGGQKIFAVTASFALAAGDMVYSNFEFQAGGGLAARWVATWPATGWSAGQEWIVSNTSGQTCYLQANGGAKIVPLQNQERKKIYHDGAELRECRASFASEFVAVYAAPTKTFSFWDEVDADYIEITPSGGNLTALWPNAGVLGERGRRTVVKNDHGSSSLTLKTNGAAADKTAVLLPGETHDFLIDDAGSLVPMNLVAYARRVSLSAMTDADYTVTRPDYLCVTLEVPASLTLTATRKVILPLVDNHRFDVANLSAGGQSITVIGATGAGVTIANGKTAIVRTNGTDYLRVTPDA